MRRIGGGALFTRCWQRRGCRRTPRWDAQDIQRTEQLAFRVVGVSRVLTLAGKVGQDPVHAFRRARLPQEGEAVKVQAVDRLRCAKAHKTQGASVQSACRSLFRATWVPRGEDGRTLDVVAAQQAHEEFNRHGFFEGPSMFPLFGPLEQL